MWKKALFSLLFWGLFPTLLLSQTLEDQIVPGGTRRWMMENARSIVQAGKDTTRGVFIAGVDQWAYYVKYASRNDSINVKIYLDLSADGITYKTWRSAALDSTLVSGTGDIDTLVNITNPPNYAMYARLRVNGAIAAADTVDVTVKWVLTWLPVVFNP